MRNWEYYNDNFLFSTNSRLLHTYLSFYKLINNQKKAVFFSMKISFCLFIISNLFFLLINVMEKLTLNILSKKKWNSFFSLESCEIFLKKETPICIVIRFRYKFCYQNRKKSSIFASSTTHIWNEWNEIKYEKKNHMLNEWTTKFK